jgi:hypothetical protein
VSNTTEPVGRLLPCPFCGSEAILEDERLLWVVRCSSCCVCVLGDRAPEPEQELPESYWAPFRQSAVDLWNRRAALAAEPVAVPVAVAERLPEPSIKVLAYYVNSLGKGRTICAIWVPAKTRSDSDGEDDFAEYDEETDKFYWPEGWYEQIENWEDLGWVRVYEGEVVYWQPLPKWPAHAIPVGEGEG